MWIAPQFGKKLAAFLFYVGFNVSFYFLTAAGEEKQEGSWSRGCPILITVKVVWTVLWTTQVQNYTEAWSHYLDQVTIHNKYQDQTLKGYSE